MDRVERAGHDFMEMLASHASAPPTKPVERPVVKPPAQPSKAAEPKVESTEERMARRMADQELGLEAFHLPHNKPWFDDSIDEDNAVQNAERVIAWVKEHREGYISTRNVEDGIQALRGRLTPLRKVAVPATPAPVISTPISKPISTPAPAAPVDPLPELPPYVVRVLGKNPLRTKKDVRDIPPQLYSDLYRGAHARAFRARVNYILSH